MTPERALTVLGLTEDDTVEAAVRSHDELAGHCRRQVAELPADSPLARRCQESLEILAQALQALLALQDSHPEPDPLTQPTSRRNPAPPRPRREEPRPPFSPLTVPETATIEGPTTTAASEPRQDPTEGQGFEPGPVAALEPLWAEGPDATDPPIWPQETPSQEDVAWDLPPAPDGPPAPVLGLPDPAPETEPSPPLGEATATREAPVEAPASAESPHPTEASALPGPRRVPRRLLLIAGSVLLMVLGAWATYGHLLTGGLRITSKPEGARIWINGVSSGQVTPATIKGLSLGAHRILLELDMYQTETSELSVLPLRVLTPHPAILKPAGGRVMLQVASLNPDLPPPDQVFVAFDGVGKTGVRPPCRLPVSASGGYQMTVEAPGYKPLKLPVRVPEGSEVPVNAVLEPLPARVTIVASPAEALDIERQTESGVQSLGKNLVSGEEFLASPGSGILVVNSEGFRPWKSAEPVRWAPDQKARIEVTLERELGNLDVLSQPAGAGVLIRGPVQLGGTTPARFEGLPSGLYNVTCALVGYCPEARNVRISDGQNSSTSFSLDPIPVGAPAGTPAAQAMFPHSPGQARPTPAP